MSPGRWRSRARRPPHLLVRQRHHRVELALKPRRRGASHEDDLDRVVEDAVFVDLAPGLRREHRAGDQAAVAIAPHAHHPIGHPIVLDQAHGDLNRMLGGRDRGRGRGVAPVYFRVLVGHRESIG
jgi:hypothetical protein